MLKLLFLISNFFTFFLNSKLVVEDVSISSKLVWTDGNYYLLEEENGFVLRSNLWEYNLGNAKNVEIVVIDNKVAAIYQNSDGLFLVKFEIDGTIDLKIQLLRDELTEFKVKRIKEDIYIFGGIYIINDDVPSISSLDKEDGIIIKIDSNNDVVLKAFGGVLDERMLDLFIVDEVIYFVAIKDSFTGGDFGVYGSTPRSLVLGTLTDDLEIVNYIVISEEEKVSMLSVYDGKIYLLLRNKLAIFNEELKLESVYEVENHDFAFLGANGKLVLYNGSLLAYDIESFSREEFFVGTSGKVILLENKLLLLDDEKSCFFDIIENDVSLFGTLQKLSDEFYPPLDEMIYGNYQKTTTFLTKGNIKYLLVDDYQVPLMVNVMDGGIYKVGYKLQFTGRGYLNGNSIVNNYSLEKDGVNTLELISVNGEVNKFTFNVDRKQISFIENSLRESDFEVKTGEEFYLKYTLKGIEDVNFVVVNNEEYKDFLYEEKTGILSVRFVSPKDFGIFDLSIDEINYTDKEETKVIILNETYKVNVIKENPIIMVTNENNNDVLETINLNISDRNQTIRFVEVIVLRGDVEKSFCFPIADVSLNITDLAYNETYSATLNIVYDLGSSNYYRDEIIEFFLLGGKENINLGELKVKQYTDSLEKLSLELDKKTLKNSVEKITSDKTTLYIKPTKNYLESILIGLSLMIVGFASSFMIKIAIKKRNKIN